MRFSLPALSGFRQCFQVAPMPVIALIIYTCLLSSLIYPDEYLIPRQARWHASYLGWYDFTLFAAIVGGMMFGQIEVARKTLGFLLSLFLIILVSLSLSPFVGPDFLLDTAIIFLRFAFVFLLAISLARRLGERRVEDLVIVLFFILAVSASFNFIIRFGEFNRMYAVGLTVAGFSQVAAIVAFIALSRKQKVLLFVSLAFVFMTFSRTTILVFLILLLVYVAHSQAISFRTKIKYATGITFSLIVATYLLLSFGGSDFEAVVSSRFSPENISRLNGRAPIWEFAVELFRDNRIPLTGVGFYAAPSLLAEVDFSVTEGSVVYYPAHFHTIWAEYGFGLGIFSIFIFYYLIKRTIQTYRARCYPAFLIYAFFILSQSVDFTFYQPKIVVLWSLFLGLAEGQWMLERRRINLARESALYNLPGPDRWQLPAVAKQGME